MIIKTLFHHEGRFQTGEVEIHLMPGIPILHVVGMPDSHIKEAGMRLKSALRACDLHWPKGHQIVVNLRPSYFRKSSSGVDLAIALGFLALTNQVSEAVKARLGSSYVYGEVALDGRVFAPDDLNAVLRVANGNLITGLTDTTAVREGRWSQISSLSDAEYVAVERSFDWNGFWREPELPDLQVHESAFNALLLAAHLKLNVLVAGPQGSGKTTWAKLLYGLSPAPEKQRLDESCELFGDEVLNGRWRPCEAPHHSITTQAMIGGGSPLMPGIISRAHGGVLIMDEFLQYPLPVLESLREPVESGFVELARKGERRRLPARFQLVGTTNLCPCGKLRPEEIYDECKMGWQRCRTVCVRLSGPVMDRFDILVFSHEWLSMENRRSTRELKPLLNELRQFAEKRGEVAQSIPEHLVPIDSSLRRHQSLQRVARGLADFERSTRVFGRHYLDAEKWVLSPMKDLGRLFA